jgi:hypothetical protein
MCSTLSRRQLSAVLLYAGVVGRVRGWILSKMMVGSWLDRHTKTEFCPDNPESADD